jgi:hypothetical protein
LTFITGYIYYKEYGKALKHWVGQAATKVKTPKGGQGSTLPGNRRRTLEAEKIDSQAVDNSFEIGNKVEQRIQQSRRGGIPHLPIMLKLVNQ